MISMLSAPLAANDLHYFSVVFSYKFILGYRSIVNRFSILDYIRLVLDQTHRSARPDT